MHDCKTCAAQGRCPIESIAPWLNEHDQAVSEALRANADAVSKALTQLYNQIMPLNPDPNSATMTAAIIFALAYKAGAEHQTVEVPDVFKKAFETKEEGTK